MKEGGRVHHLELHRFATHIFTVWLLCESLVNSGHEAFLYRSAEAEAAIARARVLFGGSDFAIEDLNSVNAVTEWITTAVVPGFSEQQSFVGHCDAIDFVQLPKMPPTMQIPVAYPQLWLRALSRESSKKGCESPFFGLAMDHKLPGNIELQASAKHQTECASALAGEDSASNGFFAYFFHQGLSCNKILSLQAVAPDGSVNYTSPIASILWGMSQCDAKASGAHCYSLGDPRFATSYKSGSPCNYSDPQEGWQCNDGYVNICFDSQYNLPQQRDEYVHFNNTVKADSKGWTLRQADRSCESGWLDAKEDALVQIEALYRSTLKSSLTSDIGDVLIGGYLPFRNGDVVHALFVVSQSLSGLIEVSEYWHVTPADIINEMSLLFLNLLAACVSILLASHSVCSIFRTLLHIGRRGYPHLMQKGMHRGASFLALLLRCLGKPIPSSDPQHAEVVSSKSCIYLTKLLVTMVYAIFLWFNITKYTRLAYLEGRESEEYETVEDILQEALKDNSTSIPQRSRVSEASIRNVDNTGDTQLWWFEDRQSLLRSCEVVLFAWSCDMLASEAHHFFEDSVEYWRDRSKFVDWVLIAFAGAFFVAIEDYMTELKKVHATIVERAELSSYLGSWQEEVTYFFVARDGRIGLLFGFLVFVLGIRFCKFLACSPLLAVPFDALIQSTWELFAFGVLLFIFTLSFALFFHFSFGAILSEFTGVGESMKTLILAVTVGEFDISIFNVDRRTSLAGMLMMTAYVILVGLILINLLIGIISESYSLVKQEKGSLKLLHEHHRLHARNLVNFLRGRLLMQMTNEATDKQEMGLKTITYQENGSGVREKEIHTVVGMNDGTNQIETSICSLQSIIQQQQNHLTELSLQISELQMMIAKQEDPDCLDRSRNQKKILAELPQSQSPRNQPDPMDDFIGMFHSDSDK